MQERVFPGERSDPGGEEAYRADTPRTLPTGHQPSQPPSKVASKL